MHARPQSGGGEWSIGLGLFSMQVPDDWSWEERYFDEGTFRLPNGLPVACSVESFDDPETIASRRFDRYAQEDGFDTVPANPEDCIDNVVGVVRPPRDGRPWAAALKSLSNWKGARIRVARFFVEGDPGDAEPDMDLIEALGRVIALGTFAATETPLDRIAPSPTLKGINVANVIHMRVPTEWVVKRQNPDGTGMYLVEPPDSKVEDITLWLDYDALQFKSGAPPCDLEALARAHLARPEIAPGSGKIEWLDDVNLLLDYAHPGEEDGEALRFKRWHRYLKEPDCTVIAHFSFVVLEREAELRHILDRLALIDREIRNALIRPPAG